MGGGPQTNSNNLLVNSNSNQSLMNNIIMSPSRLFSNGSNMGGLAAATSTSNHQNNLVADKLDQFKPLTSLMHAHEQIGKSNQFGQFMASGSGVGVGV